MGNILKYGICLIFLAPVFQCDNLLGKDQIKLIIFSTGDGFSGHYVKDGTTEEFANVAGSFKYEKELENVESLTVTVTGLSLSTTTLELQIFRDKKQIKSEYVTLTTGATARLNIRTTYNKSDSTSTTSSSAPTK